MSSVASAAILFREAERMGLKPEKVTAYGVFSFQVKGKVFYGFDSRTILNDQIASYLAQNKHVTRLIMERNGLPNIPYLLPETQDEAKRFLTQHRSIVMKPTMGTHSRNVFVINAAAELENHDLSEMIIEKYIAGREFRYLVLDQNVIAVHERQSKGLINDPETVRRISSPETAWDNDLAEIALQAARALGLRFAAVDYKVTKENRPYILEINSAPGLEWFHHPTSGPAVNVARMLLEKVIVG